MPTRKVFMLGQSGAGKSSIGNKLLQNPIAFKPSPIGSNESQTTEISQSQSILEDLQLVVYDTQGMGDTKGRSTMFLDQIVTGIKKERPHGFIFVINGGSGSKFGPDVKHALRCFAQCLKPGVDSKLSLPLGRVLLVVNHLPSDETFGGSFGQSVSDAEKKQALARAVDESNELLSSFLGASHKFPVEHVFGVQENGGAMLDLTIKNILAAIKVLPDEPLDIGQFRTFAEVMKESNDLKNNAVSAHQYAENKVNRLKYDIGWHEQRIKDCSIAMAATCWIPFANVATNIGFGAAIIDSQSAIPGLKRELQDVMAHKEQVLAVAKKKAEEWLNEMNELKSAMDTR